jgi:hypothetical protein
VKILFVGGDTNNESYANDDNDEDGDEGSDKNADEEEDGYGMHVPTTLIQ